MSKPQIPDALVVGAGPTGLTMAAELRRRGMAVRLIDQVSAPVTQSRALGLQSRTLEIFEKMGVIEEILKEGRQVQKGNIYRDGKQIAQIDFSSLCAPYPFILSLPQSDTENILIRHFEKLGGRVERPLSFTRLEEGAAILKHPNGEEEIVKPRWLLGCDGAHSTVRRSLGLPFTGTRFPETFVLADITLSSPLSPEEAHLFFHKKGIVGLLPLPHNHLFRLVSILPQNSSLEGEMLNIPFFQTLIDTCTTSQEIQLKEILWTSIFHVHRKIVSQMRFQNIFLLGDAAHIHSPAGGQGLNTSVQDAYNLAWKLALVHQDASPKALLDSYEQERLPVAREVLKGTTRATQLIKSSLLRTFLFPLARLLLNSKALGKKLISSMSELNVHYCASPIVCQPLLDSFWEGPKAGERAPDLLLSKGGKRLFDFLRCPEHVLLCFGDNSLAQEIEKRYGTWIRIYQISKKKEESPTLWDEEGNFARIYHAEAPCLYLIRPDGYIAYRAHGKNHAHFLEYLKKIFL